MTHVCKWLLVLLPLAVGIGVAAHTRDGETAKVVWPTQEEVERLQLAELIATLPPIGSEGYWERDREEPEWVEHPTVAELRRRIDRGDHLDDAHWLAALERSGVLRVRARWPAERPFAVSLRMPDWLTVGQIRLSAPRHGLGLAEVGELLQTLCGTYAMGRARDALYQELGELPPGAHALEFIVEIERGRHLFSQLELTTPPPGMLWRGALTVPVEVVPTIADALPPVSSPELDQILRNALFATLGSSEESPARLSVERTPELDAELRTLGLSLAVDVLHHGHSVEAFDFVVARAWDVGFLPPGISSLQAPGARFMRSIPPEDRAELAAWAVRVRGTPRAVERLWHAERHWSGALEIPLEELLARGER